MFFSPDRWLWAGLVHSLWLQIVGEKVLWDNSWKRALAKIRLLDCPSFNANIPNSSSSRVPRPFN